MAGCRLDRRRTLKHPVQVKCWVSKSGKKPVKSWIERLDEYAFKKVDKMIGLLRELGPSISMPHSRYLGDYLYELRDRSKGPGLRIYYTWEDDVLVILLAAGDKSSQVRDIENARKRLDDEG
jgi:putative addiction module killer protein